MSVKRFHIHGPALIQTPVHRDERGYFMESYHAPSACKAIGFDPGFVQDNLSHSVETGTLRGLHLQTPPFAQGKLVRCISGSVFDVIVDVRRGSPTYQDHIAAELTAGDGLAFWIPAGFLHGFVTRAPDTILSYKTTDHYDAKSDVSVRWDDPDLDIDWGLSSPPVISQKDSDALSFEEFDTPFGYNT